MSEFADVVTRRRMTRAFRPDPVPHALLAELVDLASRAPSAGKTQGWHLVVLNGEDTAKFWDVTFPHDEREGFPWPRLLDAPVIALPLADPQAYLDRYSADDKAESGLGSGTDAWPVPYWTIDTAMTINTLLLGAENAGMGALFFGVFNDEAALRARLGIPERLELLGAIALGYPVDGASPPPTLSHRPRRRTPDQIIHVGGW
jgi:nitroreductase